MELLWWTQAGTLCCRRGYEGLAQLWSGLHRQWTSTVTRHSRASGPHGLALLHRALGVLHYDWCVGSRPAMGACDILPWTSIGLATAVYNASLLLPEGAVYYTSVRVTDRAGQSFTAMSDGVRVLATRAVLLSAGNASAGVAEFVDDNATVVLNSTQGIAQGTLPASYGTASAFGGDAAPPRDRRLCDLSPLHAAQLAGAREAGTQAELQGNKNDFVPQGLESVLTGSMAG